MSKDKLPQDSEVLVETFAPYEFNSEGKIEFKVPVKLYKYKTDFCDDELVEEEWRRKVTGSLARKGYRIEVDHISRGLFQVGRTIWYYYVQEEKEVK